MVVDYLACQEMLTVRISERTDDEKYCAFDCGEYSTVHDYFSRAATAARKMPKTASDTRLKSLANP